MFVYPNSSSLKGTTWHLCLFVQNFDRIAIEIKQGEKVHGKKNKENKNIVKFRAESPEDCGHISSRGVRKYNQEGHTNF